jgi:biopolymer transport protein ExbD
MSHGTANEAEPNLTPLLDVVLQLLMFFMMCVNFVTEQVSGDIKLPVSDSAKPIDKADVDALFLNQKLMTPEFRDKLRPDQLERLRGATSVVLVPGKEPMRLSELQYWLKQQYEDARKKSEDGQVHTTIHLRPDGDLTMEEFHDLMRRCRAAGYQSYRVRSIIRSGG